jgi:hypothetical protein
MQRRLVRLVIFLAVAGITPAPQFAAASQGSSTTASATLTRPDRLLMASRIYHTISTFFPNLSQEHFAPAATPCFSGPSKSQKSPKSHTTFLARRLS